MRLNMPSLHHLGLGLLQTCRRFPWTILYALAGMLSAQVLVGSDPQPQLAVKLVLCCELGLVFSIALTVWAESRKVRTAWLQIALLALLTGYFFLFPPALRGADWYRFFLLAAFGHLAVSVAPFLKKGSVGDFWHYNKTLFLKFLTAFLYSAVLFAGICVAVLAIDELFKLGFNDNIYFRIWLVIAAVFNTCFFLANLPPADKDHPQDYPKGLKIFTQYVLIPLISIYVVILLVYEIKILVQGSLPNGWVANLIIAFAVAGILSLLLIHPIRKQEENKWILWYSKIYYIALIPLTLLLFVAIITRLRSYGFTEERFLVLATGLWLVFIIVYTLSRKQAQIKIIPLSLMAVIMVTLLLISPICIRSQQNRLRAMLLQNHRLQQGKITDAGATLSPEQRSNITSIVQYLYENHGRRPLQPFFAIDLSRLDSSYSTYVFTNVVLDSVNIEAIRPYQLAAKSTGITYFHIYSKNNATVQTTGYDYLLNGPYLDPAVPDQARVWQVGHHQISIQMNDSLVFLVQLDDSAGLELPAGTMIRQLVWRYANNGTEPEDMEELTLAAENDRMKVKLLISDLSGHTRQKALQEKTLRLSFDCLIRLK